MKTQIKPNQIKNFKHILKILNHFYESTQGATKLSLFRKELIKTNEDQIAVEVETVGKNEFMVHASILKNGNAETHSWLHIDGIEEEREKYREAGFLDHPVFGITNLTDIVNA